MNKASVLRNVDTAVQTSIVNSETYFSQLLNVPGVHHASYIAINLPGGSERDYFLRTSFPESWALHYAQQGYLEIDPAMRRALNGLMPFDWADLAPLSHSQAKLFGESREFGVGERGLCIPLRSQGGEVAVVSITGNMSERSWKQFKREKTGELRLLASLLNVGVMRELRKSTTTPDVALTDREIECLRWSAEGKSFEEIAVILSISSRTVRFFLDNARRKLNCLNIVQAVVTALQRGLI